MDHPFHQHVNAAQVLSVTGGDPAYASLYARIPAWKDTVLVPKGGSVTMLVPVKDFEGIWRGAPVRQYLAGFGPVDW